MSLSILLINTVLTQQTFVGLEDVLKTSSKHVLKTPSTRLQRKNIWSSKTSGRRLAKTFWRRLEDISQDVLQERRTIVTLKTPSRHLDGMSWRRLKDMSWSRLQDMSWSRLSNMSSRHLHDVLEEKKKWGYLYLTNRNGYVSNKSLFYKPISDESKGHPESLIRTQWFQYSSYLKIQAGFLFWELKSPTTVWYCEINWIQIQHCRTGETIKTKF